MNTSQKYLLAGSISLVVALGAFVSGTLLVFQSNSRSSTSPLQKTIPVQTPVPTSTEIVTTMTDDDTKKEPTSLPAVKTGYTRYTGEEYKISFDYPESWEMGADLSFQQQDIQVSFADSFYEKDEGDFIKGLLVYLNSICSADGPTGSIQCLANDAKVLPYTTPLGVKGYTISRIKTNDQFLPTKNMTLVPETVYAFPISHPDVFAIVFSPTITAKTQPKDLKNLADTLQ